MMLKYPVFMSALHEDGRRDQAELKVVAESVRDAHEQAYKYYLPRFGGEDGWTFAAVVDELNATDPEKESKST